MREIKIKHEGRTSSDIAQIIYEGFCYGAILRPPEEPGVSILRFNNDQDAAEFFDTLPNDLQEDNQ